MLVQRVFLTTLNVGKGKNKRTLKKYPQTYILELFQLFKDLKMFIRLNRFIK